ncbi:MAG: hypothetical protein ABJC36_03635 [Gemmatimonadales bacterium]
MIRLSVVALSTLLIATLGRRPAQEAGAPSTAGDTVQAGDEVVDAARLRPFSLLRQLTLTRGDTVKPFGRQSEQLTSATLDGRPVLLDVLTFETPNATTVDSSWIDARTLRPLRMRSSNAARVVALEFDGQRVRGGTTPSSGAPTTLDQQLGVRPFEWNMFGLAVSALPLQPGYRATMPVFMDRFGRVIWYAVKVVRDTSLLRANGRQAPMWEVVATGDSGAPSARFWVSQRHRFVDRVLVWEPGVSIMYARD